MHTPPFHRRVLLWVFVIVFFAVAPAAVFYTAGYRWNPKKGAIERNGTLIIDTVPSGAQITLNGTRLEKAAPVTLQDVAPGEYRIRLEIEGHHPWEKRLDVRPERVTFVNDIRLWPVSDPTRTDAIEAGAIDVSPNGRYVAYVRRRDGAVGVSINEVARDRKTEYGFSTSTFEGNGALEWNSDSTAVYVEDEEGRSWIVNRSRNEAIALPQGTYRWSGKDLIGVVEGGRYVYSVSTGATSRAVQTGDVIDTEGAYELVRSATSTNLSLRDDSERNRLYELPAGHWRFMSSIEGMIAVSDGDIALVFRNGDSPASARSVALEGALRPLRARGDTAYLSSRANEVWMTPETGPSELLLRKSVRIRGTAWHREGRDVFVATPNQVSVLNLDTRDDRMETVLANFDEIFGFGATRDALYVSARNGDWRGIWTVRVE